MDSKSAGTWYLGGSTPPPGTTLKTASEAGKAHRAAFEPRRSNHRNSALWRRCEGNRRPTWMRSATFNGNQLALRRVVREPLPVLRRGTPSAGRLCVSSQFEGDGTALQSGVLPCGRQMRRRVGINAPSPRQLSTERNDRHSVAVDSFSRDVKGSLLQSEDLR